MGSALKLYSPPSGNTPQGLPDYWKFPNGVIRRDLREIDDAELHLLGWTGPYTKPTQKQVIENVDVPPKAVEELNSSEDYTFDTENNCWVSLNHDYDPETHKVIWYSKERRYVILPIDADTTEYGIPYRSGVQPQHRINSEVTTNKKIAKTIRKFKKGKLTIGKSDKKVKNRKQAIAIALNRAGIKQKGKK